MHECQKRLQGRILLQLPPRLLEGLQERRYHLFVRVRKLPHSKSRAVRVLRGSQGMQVVLVQQSTHVTAVMLVRRIDHALLDALDGSHLATPAP
jgi:hypothetical protein